ncbi:Hypothetical predicted protein, partial [Pelobates cultripes]
LTTPRGPARICPFQLKTNGDCWTPASEKMNTLTKERILFCDGWTIFKFSHCARHGL